MFLQKNIFLGYFQKIILILVLAAAGILLPQLYGGKVENVKAFTRTVCASECSFTSIFSALAVASPDDIISIGASYVYSTSTENNGVININNANITLDCNNNDVVLGTSTAQLTVNYAATSTTIQNCHFEKTVITNNGSSDFSGLQILHNIFSTSSESYISISTTTANFLVDDNTGLNSINIGGIVAGVGTWINYNGIVSNNEVDVYWHSSHKGLSLNHGTSGVTITGNTLKYYLDDTNSAYLMNSFGNTAGMSNVIISSNTLKFMGACDQASGNTYAMNFGYATSTQITGNYIDMGMVNKTGSAPTPIVFYSTSGTVDLVINNNTIINSQNSGYSIQLTGPYGVASNFNITVTTTYNIIYNPTSTVQGTGLYFNKASSTGSFIVYEDYNGFYNLSTNISSSGVTLTQGGHDLTSNPYFKTKDSDTANDLQLAPFSSYLDVDVATDIGAYSAVRGTSFTVNPLGTIDYSAIHATTTADIISNLRSGDTLNLSAGTFSGFSIASSSLLTTGLTISGAGATTIINASTNANGINLTGINNSTIQNLVVQNASSTTSIYNITRHPFSYSAQNYIDLIGDGIGIVLWYGSGMTNVDVSVNNQDISAYVGTTPQNWHLSLISAMGKRFAIYMRADVFADCDAIDTFWTGLVGGVDDFCQLNVLTWSGSSYVYNAPTGPTVITTYQSGTPAINTTLNKYAGIKLNSLSGATVQSVTSTINGYGVWFNGTSATNNVSSSIFSSNLSYDIYSDATGNNNLKNSTFNSASSSIASTGNVNAYFKARAFVTSTDVGALAGVAVSATSTDGTQTASLTSGANGYTAYTDNLLAWTMTSSSPNSVVNGGYNPYLFGAAATSTYVASSTSANLITPNQTFTLVMTLAGVSNTAPTVTAITPVQATNGTGLVTVTTTVADVDGDIATLAVLYSLNGGSTWASSTIKSVSGTGTFTTSSGSIGNITSTTLGNAITFIWDSLVDGVTVTTTAQIKITPNDGTVNGTAATSANFTVDNVAPAVPTISTSTPATTGITLEWVAVSGASTYTVSSTASTATTTSNTTVSFTGLSVNTQYSFQILTTDAYGNASAYATATSTYTLANAPSAPTVAASSTTALNLIVNVNSNPAATTFSICKTTNGTSCAASGYVQASGALGASAVWQTYATWGGASGVDVTGLSANTSYQFLAQARNGDSVVTALSSANTAVYTLTSAPTAPTVTAASSTILSVTTTNDGATTYAVKVVTGATTKYLQADGTIGADPVWLTYAQLGSGSATSTTGLTANTSYTISVAGKNGDGTATTYTAASAVYTLANQVSAPTIGTATTSTLPITINVNSNPAATTYAIYNYTDSNYLTSAGAVTATAAYYTTSTWNTGGGSATGLTPNTSYQFQVIARNGANVNAATSSASTAAYTNPNIPGTPTVTANGQTSVIVSWDANSNPADTLYQLYNYTDAVAVGTTTSVSYTVTGLTANTSYQFNVRSQYQSDDATYSSYSATSTAVSTAAVASTVTITLSTGASSTFQLSAGGTVHTVTLDSIVAGVAKVTIASTPFSVSLSAGESSNNAANGITVTIVSVGASSAQFTLSTYTAPAAASSGGGGGSSVIKKPVITSFTINNGVLTTNSRTVTLKFNVSNASLMLLSNSTYFDSQPYLPYKSSWTWTLEPGNGLKTVYARLRSADGGEILVTQTITLNEAINPASAEATVGKQEISQPIVYTFAKDLKIGSTGEEVKQLQTKLKSLGYFVYPSITNYYGLVTAGAVKKLQTANNLKATGIVDSAVRNILNGTENQENILPAQAGQPTTGSVFTKLLTYGMRGEEVKQLQIRLQELNYLDKTITPTLNFGPATRAAVIKLQKEHKLNPPAGYTGPGTRKVLNGY